MMAVYMLGIAPSCSSLSGTRTISHYHHHRRRHLLQSQVPVPPRHDNAKLNVAKNQPPYGFSSWPVFVPHLKLRTLLISARSIPSRGPAGIVDEEEEEEEEEEEAEEESSPPYNNGVYGGGGDDEGGNDGRGGAIAWVSTAFTFAFWAAFLAYAFLLSPNQTPILDQYLVQRLLFLKQDEGYQLNTVLFCVWNVMGVWPLMYLTLLIPSGRSSKGGVPVWPFATLSLFVGAFALLPYFGLWRPAAPSVSEEEINGWPLKILDSKLFSVGLAATGSILIGMALTSGAESWTEFIQLFNSSRLTHITSLDFLTLSLLAPFWVINDMEVRKWYAKHPHNLLLMHARELKHLCITDIALHDINMSRHFRQPALSGILKYHFLNTKSTHSIATTNGKKCRLVEFFVECSMMILTFSGRYPNAIWLYE